jgi:hypothetical protein
MMAHGNGVGRALTIGVAPPLVKAPIGTIASLVKAAYGWYDPRLFAMLSPSITRPARLVRTCPDCGGILQSIEPERLTSAEVAALDERAGPDALAGQCLLCGYEERPASTPVVSADTR